MQSVRALLALMLAVTFAFTPVSVGAMDAGVHAAAAAEAVDRHVASPREHADCDAGARSDETSDETGHCGACCLAYAGVSLPTAPLPIGGSVRWAALPAPDLGSPLVLPDPTYGLKRPPRA